MDRSAQHRVLLGRALAATVAMVYVVIVSSAFLRLTQDGLGCPDWPACYAAPQPVAAETPVAARAMRVVHRIAAAGVGFAVILIAVLVFRAPGHGRRKWLAGALVALTVFLAALGRATPGAVLPAVTLGNLLGGLLMLGLAWRLRLEVAGAARAASPALKVGLALLALQLALGAAVSAFHAAASCATLPGCHGAWLPAGGASVALDPFEPRPALAGAALAADPARAMLHMLHRYGALAVAAYWMLLAFLRAGAGTIATAGVLAVQVLAGAAAVALAMPLALAVLHNALAGLAVLAAAGAAAQSRPAEAAAVSAACQIETSK